MPQHIARAQRFGGRPLGRRRSLHVTRRFVVIIALLAAGVSTVVLPKPAVHAAAAAAAAPTTYFTDGFESGTFGQWTGPTGTGSASVETSVVNSGTYAAQLTDASGQYVTLSANLAGGAQTTTYTRFYVRVASGASSSAIVKGKNAAGAVLWEVDYDTNRQGLDVYFWNGAGARTDLYTSQNAVAANTWYSVEVLANETATGQAQVWLNGSSVGSASADLSTSSAYSQLSLYNGGIGTVYFDDIKVANAYNGPIGGTPAPGVSLSPTSLVFAGQPVGSTSVAQTVTLTNSGNATLSISGISLVGGNAGDFAQTNTCPTETNTLAPWATCAISVTFTPTATGTRTASLSIADNATGSPHTIPLSGTGVTAGTYFSEDFEGGTLAQWSHPGGTGGAGVETSVVNSGSDAAALTNASGQYVWIDANLVGGGQPTTYTRFAFRAASGTGSTPVAEGRNASGTVLWEALYDAGSHGLDVFWWNGAGVRSQVYSNANAVSPDTWYSVEVQAVETSGGQGQAWLNGASLGTVSGDLSTSSAYSQLWLYSEATGSVYFDDLTVANTYNGPLVPAVSFAPSSLTFGNVPFSTTSPAQTVTLKNTGTLALAIAGIAPGGPDAAQYAQTNTCPASLSVGARCSISVTFSPGVARATSASLQVTDNAPGSPQSVALSGTGTCAALFCDGFESGTLPGAWTGQTTTGTVATLGVVTSPVRSGAYALKVSLAKGSGDRNAYVTKTLAATPSAVYVKAWFNPQATGDFGEVNLVGLYDPNGKFLAWVYYDPSLTNLYLYDINYNLTTCTQQLPTGSWHSLELGDTGTQLTLSLDGTAICSMAETGLGSVASVRIGSDGSDNTLTQTIYVDDATIDTQPIP